MANPFQVFVTNLNQLGFFGFLLPWVFIFAITFGLLAKSKVLGDDLRIIAVVSMVAGFFVMGFGGPFLANFFVNSFGMAAVVLAGILIIVLFMSMSGIGIDAIAKSKLTLVAMIAIGIIIFITAIGSVSVIVNPTVIAVLLMLVIMIAAFAFIAK
ncbi:MAG: hypothetical protein HY831_00625 [Candidatus Aenigmarchaeota archaeon]|nr:hypothetical protein [Candidatus Aenigmarchaeota archaeon]